MTNFFSSYIKTFMTVALCAFLCESVSSFSGKGKPLTKALGLICSLCILLSVTLPLVDLFKGIGKEVNKKIPETEQGSYDNSSFLILVSENLKNTVKDDIYYNTGILVESISIDLSTEDSSIIIDKITVSINEADENVRNTVAQYLSDCFGEKTSIEFKETEQ